MQQEPQIPSLPIQEDTVRTVTYVDTSTALRHNSTSNQTPRACENRSSIHISRLPHDIKTPELKDVLSHYGQAYDISIKRGKEKRCSATARYRFSNEAALAIQKLNGKRFDRFELVVRYDRSEAGSTSSAPSITSRASDDSNGSDGRKTSKAQQVWKGPLVVDGARGPVYMKTRSKSEHKENTEESGEWQQVGS